MSNESASIAGVLILIGLTAGLSGTPAAAATVDGGYANAGLARLADLLGQRGWHTRADETGNLLIYRSASGTQVQGAPVEAQAPIRPAVDTSILAERLPSYGWTVTRNAVGTLTLVPPAGRSRGGPPPSQTAPGQEQAADRAQLARRLEAGGWTVAREAGGSLRFHREVAAPRPDGTLDQGANASRDPVAEPAPDRLAALGEALKHRGWTVERGSDGTLTLHPPTTSPGLPAGAADLAPVADRGQGQVAEALANRGWDLRRDAAGNLFLTPLA